MFYYETIMLFDNIDFHHIGSVPFMNWHTGKAYKNISLSEMPVFFQNLLDISDGLISSGLLVVIIRPGTPHQIHGVEN